MASWLFTPSAFDLLLDKATSPLIPIGTHDLATNLDLADQIRAKQVQPRVAAQAIKRKLTDRNPNVQLLALRVRSGCRPSEGERIRIDWLERDGEGLATGSAAASTSD